MEASLVGDFFGWRYLWLESRSRVLTGEAKMGQDQYKKVATQPKIGGELIDPKLPKTKKS